jgi:hypothetical protein
MRTGSQRVEIRCSGNTCKRRGNTHEELARNRESSTADPIFQSIISASKCLKGVRQKIAGAKRMATSARPSVSHPQDKSDG